MADKILRWLMAGEIYVTKSGKRDLKWGMELLIPSDAD